mmetsp:Transcript_3532/g.12902  ORF Transcript_3532/g.12902 Transcript_3532/m.12902 type:complete len:252 (-) Transcript_3532:1448-2203(-)
MTPAASKMSQSSSKVWNSLHNVLSTNAPAFISLAACNQRFFPPLVVLAVQKPFSRIMTPASGSDPSLASSRLYSAKVHTRLCNTSLLVRPCSTALFSRMYALTCSPARRQKSAGARPTPRRASRNLEPMSPKLSTWSILRNFEYSGRFQSSSDLGKCSKNCRIIAPIRRPKTSWQDSRASSKTAMCWTSKSWIFRLTSLEIASMRPRSAHPNIVKAQAVWLKACEEKLAIWFTISTDKARINGSSKSPSVA